ncbi:MAG: hypothetical protein LBG11_11965, partial [Bifidobacteriaceae bacterium]|nr:hypothetical protein [Bifidobacteriaceae bacterium]
MGRSLARGGWSRLLRSRHRLPPSLDEQIEKLKWRLVRPPVELELALVPTGSRPRTLIAPANFAGQGHAWAEALNRYGPGSAVNWVFSANPVFGFAADYTQPICLAAAPKSFQSAQFALVTDHFQAVVLESGRPVFGRLFGHSAAREALVLNTVGLTVAVLWHGSDIRLPSRHIATHSLSPYALAPLRQRAAELESTARRNRRSMLHLDLLQLVSTPDLLSQVPGAEWCPVVVAAELLDSGAEERRQSAPALTQTPGKPPRVVHVPSNPLIKGTDLADPVLRRLAERGLIDYVLAEGITAAAVLELYASADVVIDQFRLGIYGVAAAEAMALGRLVVSDVDQSVYDAVQARTGLTLPVCQTPAAELEQRIEDICRNPEPYRR